LIFRRRVPDEHRLGLDDPQGCILPERKKLSNPEDDAQYHRRPSNNMTSHGYYPCRRGSGSTQARGMACERVGVWNRAVELTTDGTYGTTWALWVTKVASLFIGFYHADTPTRPYASSSARFFNLDSIG